MIIKAYAKITLSIQLLDVVDGTPSYKMIMLPLKLHDTISIDSLPPNFDTLINFAEASTAVNDSNMVKKTVKELEQNYNLKEKVHITIHKHIPTNAGLGGGSSNAAAIIRLFARKVEPKLTREQVLQLAVSIGEEVPFCIDNIPAIVEKSGELLTPIRFSKKPYVLLVKPSQDTKNAHHFIPEVNIQEEGDRFDLALTALKDGNLEELSKFIINDFEKPILEKEPEIAVLKMQLLKENLPIVHMSGSGSTIFALSMDKNKLKKLEAKYEKLGYTSILTTIL